jgi:hypothetical protein
LTLRVLLPPTVEFHLPAKRAAAWTASPGED